MSVNRRLANERARTIVVGAGPVGLTAALALSAEGIPVTVVEAGAQDRVRPGSRAIFIHGASLQLLEQIRPGLGHALNAHGLIWLTKRTLYRGRELYARTYRPPRPDVLPAATSLPQVVTEQVLHEAAVTAGVEFVWETPVAGVEATASGVTVVAESGQRFDAAYAIGADGARSSVRSSLEIPLEGPRTENAFVIVDTAEDADAPLPVERVFHYEHPAVDGRNVLFVPFAGHWRVDLQCRPDDDAEAFSGTAGVARWLPRGHGREVRRARDLGLDVRVPPGAGARVRRSGAAGAARGRGRAPLRALRRPRPELGHPGRDRRSAGDPQRAGRRFEGRGSSGRGSLRGLASSRRSPEPRGLEHRSRAPLREVAGRQNAPSRSRARGAPRHARPDAGSTRRRTGRGSGRRTPTACSTRRDSTGAGARARRGRSPA